MREVVVVGASIAGFRAAEALRAGGFDGPIRLVGDEPRRTYERPPLSKSVLVGADVAEATWAAANDDDLDLDWLLGERATGLDLDGRRLRLASGSSLDFGGLVIATGATARRLPDTPDRAGLHVLRSVDDCLGIRADLDAGATEAVVVGAGFIGAEVAASFRERNVSVTMIEPLAQPLVRVVGEVVGRAVAAMHREHGVDVRLGVGVDEVLGADRVEGVRLSDGSTIDADLVVVGIGATPNVGWLAGSALTIDDGVVCDETCLAGPGVVAAGDAARWTHPRYGPIRIEHWDNAVEMGGAAGRRLLASDDEAVPFAPVPWFWSDQYDTKIQVAGRIAPDHEIAVVDGSVDDGKFVALYGADGLVSGALGWNWPAKAMRYRVALEDVLPWEEAIGG